jgi:hypothetical protein
MNTDNDKVTQTQAWAQTWINILTIPTAKRLRMLG